MSYNEARCIKRGMFVKETSSGLMAEVVDILTDGFLGSAGWIFFTLRFNNVVCNGKPVEKMLRYIDCEVVK